MGLWSRIRQVAFTDVGVLVRGMDRAQVEDFERVLLESDVGVAATGELVAAVTERVRKAELKTAADVRSVLEERLTEILASPGRADPGAIAGCDSGLVVLMMVGVNGSGKTTAAAKLGARLKSQDRRVLLCAADTYRAGAVQQLDAWAERLELPCIRGASGADPAAVAFDAVEAAIARGLDTVIVDTAGRLHTQDDLMKELQKVSRVVGRKAPGAPHETLLVLDGSTGQNAVQQGKVFRAALPVTGLFVTKLDGTARGGTVVALRRELDLPVRFLGVGEGAGDIEVFDARAYAKRLLAD
jgi:fused signal recognition particle receptor